MSVTEVMYLPVHKVARDELEHWGAESFTLVIDSEVNRHLEALDLLGTVACHSVGPAHSWERLKEAHSRMRRQDDNPDSLGRRDYFITEVLPATREVGKLIGMAAIEPDPAVQLYRGGILPPELVGYTPLKPKEDETVDRAKKDLRVAQATVWTDPTRERYTEEIAGAMQWVRDYAPAETHLVSIIPKRFLNKDMAYRGALEGVGFNEQGEGRFLSNDHIPRRPPKSTLFMRHWKPIRLQSEA